MKDIKISKATFFAIGAALSFTLMALLVKKVALIVNSSTIIFFRFAISLVYISLVIFIRNLLGKKISLKTNHIYFHVLRSLTALASMICFYYSLRYISLVDGTVLMMTNPLFVPIIGVFFLGIKTDYKHWIAVIIGFLGTLLVLKPGHSLFNPKAIYAMYGGFFAAVSLIAMREQTKRDNIYLCLFYYFLFATIASGSVMIFDFVMPDPYVLLLLLGVGITGVSYQECLIRATEIAPAKIVGSLMYTSLIFSFLFSWLFFSEIPDMFTIIGVLIICLGGILTFTFAKKKYS